MSLIPSMDSQGTLMTPENVSYLADKQIYVIFTNMLTHILKYGAEHPDVNPIPSLIHMLEGKKDALRRPPSAEYNHALTVYGIKKPLEAFAAPPSQQDVVDLHYRFQGHQSLPIDSPAKVIQRRQLLQQALNHFASFAMPVVRRIVHELPRHFSAKEIPPITEGGDTFLHAGLVIRMAGITENTLLLLGSRENASKILSHETKATGCVLSASVHELHVPLSVKVTYLSHPFWVHTRLPLSPESLVYGSIDAGKTIAKASCIMNGLMKRLGEALHLKSHAGGQDPERSKVIYGPSDIQGYHCQLDGKFYLMSLSRLFPPTAPDPHIKNSYLIRMLRPEAVQASVRPLSSDAFSPFCLSPADNEEVNAVTQDLFNRIIPNVAAILLRQHKLTCEKLVELAHHEGLNCRYFGRLFPSVMSSQLVTTVLSTELAARTFRRILEDEWFADSKAPGVNLRDYEDSAIQLFHLLLDGTEVCRQFWKERLIPRLVAKYGSFNSLNLISFDNVDRPQLFLRCCQFTGCRFGGSQALSFPEFQVPPEWQPKWAPTQNCEILPVCKVPQVRPLNHAEELCMTGKVQESITQYKALIERIEGTLGPASPSLVPLLNGLAIAYQALGPGHEAEVESLLSRVIVLRDMDEGTKDTCYMEALRLLAEFYTNQRNYDAAVQALQTAVGLFKQMFGEDHLGLPQFLIPLGNVHFWRREPEKTMQCYLEALAVRKENYGAHHSEVADSLMHLGLLHLRLDLKQEDAVSYLRQALAMMRSTLGTGDHPSVGRILYHLAVLVYESERPYEAMQLFLQTLPMLERCFGPHDALVLGATTYIKELQGIIYAPPARKRITAAPTSFDEAEFMDDDKELHDLLDQGEYEAAIPLFDRHLWLQKEEFGAHSPEYATALMQCGNNFLQAERYELAAEKFLEAAKVMKAAFAPTHIYVADALNSVAEAHVEAGNYDEAAAAYEQALAISDVHYADKVEALHTSWARVAKFHFRFGKMAKSLHTWRKVLELRVSISGENDPVTKSIREEMQKVYDEVDRLEQKQAQLE